MPTDRRSNSRRRLALTAVIALALSVAGGLVWLWLAEPAQWQVRDSGIVLTEGAAKGQFSVIVTFIAVGCVASVLIGVATALLLADRGWVITPVAAALAIVAALIAWRIGVELGPVEPAAAAGRKVGDLIPARLEVDTVAAFLVWPIAALVGVVATVFVDRRHRDDDPQAS